MQSCVSTAATSRCRLSLTPLCRSAISMPRATWAHFRPCRRFTVPHTTSIRSLEELLERDRQREKDGFPRKIRVGRLIRPGKGGKEKVVVVPTTVEEKFVHDQIRLPAGRGRVRAAPARGRKARSSASSRCATRTSPGRGRPDRARARTTKWNRAPMTWGGFLPKNSPFPTSRTRERSAP